MEEDKFCPTFQYCSKYDSCKAETCHPIKPRWYVKCIPWIIGVLVFSSSSATLIVTGILVAINLNLIQLGTRGTGTTPLAFNLPTKYCTGTSSNGTSSSSTSISGTSNSSTSGSGTSRSSTSISGTSSSSTTISGTSRSSTSISGTSSNSTSSSGTSKSGRTTILPNSNDGNLTSIAFVFVPKTFDEAYESVRQKGPDMQLVTFPNPEDEEYFIDQSKKHRNYSKCAGQFFTGYHLDTKRSWVALGTIYIEGYTSSDMWSNSVENGENSFRCSALSRQHNFRMVNVPCEFSTNDKFCFICETRVNCPKNSKGRCYKTFDDAINGIDTARRRCGNLDIKGNLAVPYDKKVWSDIKTAFSEDASKEKCQIALLEPTFVPAYESVLGTWPTYTPHRIDTYRGKMGDQCVVTHGSEDYFILANCSKPMCYAYFNASHLPAESSSGLVGPTSPTVEKTQFPDSGSSVVPPNLGDTFFVDIPLSVNHANMFLENKGELVVITNPEEEHFVLNRSKSREKDLPCEGVYFTGHRIKNDSWVMTTNQRFPSFWISNLWHPEIRNRSSAYECCALSRKHDYKLINVPCEYGDSLKMCIACQSEFKCPSDGERGVCYKIITNRTAGAKMATALCNHPNIDGTLAVPYDESMLELIKQRLTEEDKSKSCELLLLEPKYDPHFESINKSFRTTYTFREIDTSNWTMGDRCVVTAGNHFGLADCDSPHCFAYIDNGFFESTDDKSMVFYPYPKNASEATKSGLLLGNGLVEIHGPDEETKFFEKAKKYRNDTECKGLYLIGQRVDMARSWKTKDGIYIEGYTLNEMWSSAVKDGKNIDLCSAMSKSHDYKIINFPCEFPKNDTICFVCERTGDCPENTTEPCYEMKFDVINGVEMAKSRCSDLKLNGRLAVPRDKATWISIKNANSKADSIGKCKTVLLDAMYVPAYESLNDKTPIFTLQNIDSYGGNMGDQCVATSGLGDYFIHTDCSKPHCYVYFSGIGIKTTPSAGNATIELQTNYTSEATTEISVPNTQNVIPPKLIDMTTIDNLTSQADIFDVISKLGPDLQLVRVENIEEENYLLDETKKLDTDPPCYGVYLTGHRISSFSWSMSSGGRFVSFESSELWHPEVRTRKSADRCCAMSVKHDYKLVNIPCEFDNDDGKIWFACYTEFNCPSRDGCYKIIKEVVYGVKMASVYCKNPKINGSLALTINGDDETVLEDIKLEFVKADKSKSTEFLLLDPVYDPYFKTNANDPYLETNATASDFYMMQKIDVSNWTMGDLCVVTLGDHFGLADCGKPHCYIYVNDSVETKRDYSASESQCAETENENFTSPTKPDRDFKNVIFSSVLKNATEAASFGNEKGNGLVEFLSRAAEEKFLAMAKKFRDDAVCKGTYYTGHRVDLRRSWTSSQGVVIKAFTQCDMWSPSLKYGNNSARCSGLSISYDYEMINVPCDFREEHKVCFICETTIDCPRRTGDTCYKVIFDFVTKADEARVTCKNSTIGGVLAAPSKKRELERIKKAFAAANTGEKCHTALLDLRYGPAFESLTRGTPTYLVHNIVLYNGTMSDHCVVTTNFHSYFKLVNCAEQHCFAYFGNESSTEHGGSTTDNPKNATSSNETTPVRVEITGVLRQLPREKSTLSISKSSKGKVNKPASTIGEFITREYATSTSSIEGSSTIATSRITTKATGPTPTLPLGLRAVKIKLNVTDAKTHCENLGMKLAIADNEEEEDDLIDAANHLPVDDCEEEYLTGYRLHLDASWKSRKDLGQTNDRLPLRTWNNKSIMGPLLSPMWTASSGKATPNGKCVAMMKNESFQLAPIQCQFEVYKKLCYICESNVGCPTGRPTPCYHTFFNRLNSGVNVNEKCASVMTGGQLAFPSNKRVLDRVKEAHLSVDKRRRCDMVLVDILFDPTFEVIGEDENTYSPTELDTRYGGTITDHCLAVGKYTGFSFSSCDEPKCFLCKKYA